MPFSFGTRRLANSDMSYPIYGRWDTTRNESGQEVVADGGRTKAFEFKIA